jgi:Lrp/AsnC family transcriptional regulator, leucine-responsive regulatory protein
MVAVMDEVDRRLLSALQRDATQSYVALGAAAGLSAGSAHERVRKLRDRRVIRRTTVDVDPAAVGRTVRAYVLVEANAWMGTPLAARAFAALPDVIEAHVIAGGAAILLKIRAESTEALQTVLRDVYAIDGVTGTQTIVALDTFFERPVNVGALP